MVASMLGIISAAIGVVALLLKFYPEWKRRRDAESDEAVMDEFGEALLNGDDARVSELLDAEFRRVRGKAGEGAP